MFTIQGNKTCFNRRILNVTSMVQTANDLLKHKIQPNSPKK